MQTETFTSPLMERQLGYTLYSVVLHKRETSFWSILSVQIYTTVSGI